MKNDKLTIRVNINERFYPLKIEAKDEEKIRKAAKNINTIIAKYRKAFNDNDGQDLLAMVALQFGKKVIDLDDNYQLSEVVNDIKALNQDLEQFIKE